MLFLQEKMKLMQKQFFGRSSERRASEAGAEQLNIFSAGIGPQSEKNEKQTITYERKVPKQREQEARGEFPAHLERVVVKLAGEQPQEEHTIEWVKVSEHLCCHPSQFYVKQYQRPVYKTKSGEVVSTPAPEAVFRRVMVDRTKADAERSPFASCRSHGCGPHVPLVAPC